MYEKVRTTLHIQTERGIYIVVQTAGEEEEGEVVVVERRRL